MQCILNLYLRLKTVATGRVKSKTTNLVFVASLLKHAAFRSKRKDWSTHNQDNVSEWTDISTCRM